MGLNTLATGVGVLLVGATACGGNSAQQPATEQPSASAGASVSGSAGAGASGKPSQGGAGSGGVAGTAGTAGRSPQSGCPMDLGSWTVETCYPISNAPGERPSAEGGSHAGGAAGEGGEGGSADPTCPPPLVQSPFDSPPMRKGDQCCYFHTQICG